MAYGVYLCVRMYVCISDYVYNRFIIYIYNERMYAQPNFKLYLTLFPNSYIYIHIWILINISLKNTGGLLEIFIHIYILLNIIISYLILIYHGLKFYTLHCFYDCNYCCKESVLKSSATCRLNLF